MHQFAQDADEWPIVLALTILSLLEQSDPGLHCLLMTPISPNTLNFYNAINLFSIYNQEIQIQLMIQRISEVNVIK